LGPRALAITLASSLAAAADAPEPKPAAHERVIRLLDQLR